MIGRPRGTSVAGTYSSVPTRGEIPEYPEWGWEMNAQDIGNKKVMREKIAIYRVVLEAAADAGCRAEAVELIAFLNTIAHADFMFSVGGTPALTPALSRSGEGEFSAASVWCGSLGLSCGGNGDRGRSGADAGTLEDKGDVRGRVRVGGNQAPWNTAVAVAMAGMDGAAEIRGQRSEDGCDFVLEEIGGELVRRRNCPEFSKWLCYGGGGRGRATEGGLHPISNPKLPESGYDDLPLRSPLPRHGHSAPAAEHGNGVVRRESSSGSGCWGAGQGTRCQAQVLPSGEIPEYPEWGWEMNAQDIGNKKVMREKIAIYRVVLEAAADAGCRAEAVELIAFLNTIDHAGFMFSVGGTSALTPTLSRSGEGEFSAASVRCGSLGLSCGGNGKRGRSGADAGTLEE